MRKTFRFKSLLLGLLAMTSTTSFAQIAVGDKFPDGNFIYEVTTAAVANGKAGAVKILGVREGKNPVVDKKLVLSSTCSATVAEDVYNFTVTTFDTDALRKYVDRTGADKGTFTGQVDAESVEFPKYITEIPAGALDGYTNMNTVTFQSGSNLTTVNDGAFATTQITTFNFGNCTKLAGLGDGVFVEAGKTNSYITEVTLPATTLFKSIGAAFKGLTSLTDINGLENSSVTAIVANAFDGDGQLQTLTLPNTVQTIADDAFKGSGIETLTIDVTSMVTLGAGAQVYGTTNVLKSLTLKGNLGGVISVDAFKGATMLETLNLSQLNFASQGQIKGGAFEGCNNDKLKTLVLGNILDQPGGGEYTIETNAFKDCTKLESVTFGDINSANAINDKAFDGCTKLASVTLGDVLAAGAIGASTDPVFGVALKTVTIGTVKAGDAAILANAFKYADVSGTTLSLATGEGEYVSSDDAATPVIAADAFVFDDVVNAGAASGFVFPVVNIGEIRSQGGAFAAGALSGDNIAQINFKGAIAKNGLDKMIIDATCTVSTLVFDGTIGIGGIATGAFKELPAAKVNITFNGELAEGAIASKAFESLKVGSKVSYTKTPLTDATVNPFDKEAFSDGTANATTARIIDLEVTDTDLHDAYADNSFEGLTTDGVFEIYLVKFYEAPVDPIDPNKFMVYQDGTSTTAWARYWGNAWEDLEGNINDKKINRYQTVEGGAKVKLTMYGTYTDDPGAANGDPAIYMVPLKSKDGIYEISKTQNEAIIVKAEIVNGGTFADKDIELSFTTTITNDSWWTNLTNTDLFINPSIITNQQLIDKTKDVPVVVDIYNGGTSVAYDLYVMSNPAAVNKTTGLHKAFRIDKNEISKDKKTYIGEGWWCMLLRKTTGTAAARVLWLDEPEATAIFAVKDVKAVENNAIYTLQGVRVSAPQKGMIYIQNGKKFIAK